MEVFTGNSHNTMLLTIEDRALAILSSIQNRTSKKKKKRGFQEDVIREQLS
jgi:hypothetical protein